MIEYARLAAPREHLGLLVEPAAVEVHAALAARADEALARVVVAGRPLGAWRDDVRRRLSLAGPVIAAGHQAEFFHAGVFAKTIAAHVLAAGAGGTPLFVLVDSDVPKTRSLTVPEITAGGLRRVEVRVPACDLQRPIECQPGGSRQEWLDFFVQVGSLYEHYDAALLRPFADAWVDTDQHDLDLCAALARGWTAMEECLGLNGVRHLRLSQLCATAAFRAFAAHLMLHAPRLAADYNMAVAAYRQRHRIRTPSRPVPPLVVSGEVAETPLWVFRCEGSRQRLHVADQDSHVQLLAGREPIAELSKSSLANPERLADPWPFEHAGWRLRPRALALSAFLRLFVADLFIHGIGGAMYDEVTDEWLSRFFGIQPPPWCCVSATVLLPLPRTGVRVADLLAARRQTRDVVYNPQRYVRNVPPELCAERTALIRRSDELRANHSRDHAARRAIFEGIRRANDQILAHDPWRPAEFAQLVQTLEQRAALDRIASDREYFVGLHLKSAMAELVRRLRDALRANAPRD